MSLTKISFSEEGHPNFNNAVIQDCETPDYKYNLQINKYNQPEI